MKHFADISATAISIVDAAESLLQHHGYHGFSIDDVAVRVGVRKPTVHHHFATKAALVGTVVQRHTHRFREHLLRIEGTHGAPPARLSAYAGLFARTFAKDRRLCVCGMLGAESDALPAEVRESVDRFFRVNLEWLADAIAAGQRAGLYRSKPPAADLASAFLGVLEGAMVLGRGMRSSRGPAEAGRTFLSIAAA